MAKKKTDPELPIQPSTEVAIIEPKFETLAEFKLPNVDESIAIIAEKRKEYSLLVIDGVDDKVGYESVKVAMAQMKNDRIAFVNSATETVIDPATRFLKKFKEDLGKIADKFKAGEDELRVKKDFIDSEKVRIKAEAELEKVRVMQIRVNDLNVLGAQFDGKVYTFPYSEMLMITAGDIKDFDEEQFTQFTSEVQTAYDREQQRIRDAQVLKDAEAERVRQELAQVNQKAQQNTADEARLIQKQATIRKKELALIGYKEIQNDEEFVWVHETIPVRISLDQIIEMEDSKWDEFIYDLEHFTIAEEPLVKVSADESPITATLQGPNTNVWPTPTEPLVNPLAKPETEEPPNPLTEVGFVGVEMIFDKHTPFTDIDLTPKSIMRVYPNEYEAEALAGIEVVGNQGELQSLKWIIFKKA